MSRLEISKIAGLVVSIFLLFCPDAILAQSRSERARIQELFAARDIAKLAYTVARADSAGWVFEANEITKEHPSPRLLWKFDASEPDYTVDGKKLAFDLGRNAGKSTGIYVMDGRISGGSELLEEHPPTSVTHISWSHDGTKLAFAAEQHKNT